MVLTVSFKSVFDVLTMPSEPSATTLSQTARPSCRSWVEKMTAGFSGVPHRCLRVLRTLILFSASRNAVGSSRSIIAALRTRAAAMLPF